METESNKTKRRKVEPPPATLKDLIYNTKEPLIFKNILSWDIFDWSLNDWIKYLEDSKLDFRIGTKICSKIPQWENQCETVSLSLDDVLKNHGESSDVWMYFDYKHINQYFKSKSKLLESLSWADFGLEDKNGKDSTIWIGTKGAHTPCHMDSYGCNIVAQVHGRKLWVLFPPSSTSVLRPTRVPYEESSVYSKINFSCGLNVTDEVGEARVVELAPGDVLVVPRHWWHYVENLSTAISINMWIPRESDDQSRLEEALVRFSIATIIKGLGVDVTCAEAVLLNPNEIDLPDETVDLRQISWCLEHVAGSHKQVEGNEESSNNFDLDCVSSVEKVSPNELRRKLLDKCGCETDHFDNIKLKPLATEDIINAFCHPSVISQVANLLLASRRK